MKHLFGALLLVAFALPLNADPLSDFLEGKGYDREAILRQIEKPAKSIGDDNVRDDDSKNDSGGGSDDAQKNGDQATETIGGKKGLFLSPAITPPADGDAESLPSDTPELAMILPVNADGLIGAAARGFYDGCLHGARAAGAELRINLYETNGQAAAALAAYRQAVGGGAPMIIGPMQKKSVDAVLEKYPKTAAPTILLQPKTAARDDNYYVMTLEAGAEAAQLARLLLRAGVTKIKIVQQDGSDLAARQLAAIEKVWLDNTGKLPPRFRIRDPQNDWQRLFEELKESVKKEENSGAQQTERETIFAAGNAAFVRQTRIFAPPRFAVFAGSFAYNGERGAGALALENLRFMEMPWFVRPSAAVQKIRIRPVLVQRFFAFGADVCGMVLEVGQWRENWRFAGLSGDYHFINGDFRRFGVLTKYRDGKLQTSAKP